MGYSECGAAPGAPAALASRCVCVCEAGGRELFFLFALARCPAGKGSVTRHLPPSSVSKGRFVGLGAAGFGLMVRSPQGVLSVVTSTRVTGVGGCTRTSASVIPELGPCTRLRAHTVSHQRVKTLGLGFALSREGVLWVWTSVAYLLWDIRGLQKSFCIELLVCLVLPGFFFFFPFSGEGLWGRIRVFAGAWEIKYLT